MATETSNRAAAMNRLGAGVGRRVAVPQFVKELEKALAAGDAESVAVRFRQTVVPDLDFTSASALARFLPKIRARMGAREKRQRIAVLGSFTTAQLTSFLDLFLFGVGIDADFYESDYGVVRQEALNPASGLYSFRPGIVYLPVSSRDLGRRPALSDEAGEIEAAVQEEISQWRNLWQVLYERLGCQIIQDNFEIPSWRPLGNYELRHQASLESFIRRVNQELLAAAPPFVTLHDVDSLAASVGRWNWGDERFFHLAKLPCAPEHLVAYAHRVATLVGAHLGHSKKCLVLDLDNTLWGGVVGDDGLGGIALGQGDPVGEAYLAFQRYVKSLGDRGVILAVCSKNEDANAREPFEKHPEMVLRMKDISCFVANWEDKVSNLKRVAEELNIGINSLVFVDDNPAERDLVRQSLPEVAVPEMPEDPADFIRALETHCYFQVVSLSSEDLQRAKYYQADAARKQAQTSHVDLDGFLRSLDMSAWIGPIDETDLERSVQLIAKSNQFNLTTRRHSAADVTRIIASPEWITRVVKLVDRFGDNGLISVLLARQQQDALEIDTWLMSCRVLQRGVEQCLLNHIVSAARQRGLRKLVGEYIPTAKNKLVRDHYRSLGFTLLRDREGGHSLWQLDIADSWVPLSHHIREETPRE
jgi:FkbH-like protein